MNGLGFRGFKLQGLQNVDRISRWTTGRVVANESENFLASRQEKTLPCILLLWTVSWFEVDFNFRGVDPLACDFRFSISDWLLVSLGLQQVTTRPQPHRRATSRACYFPSSVGSRTALDCASQIRITIHWLLRLLIPSRSYRPMSKGPKDCDGSSSCSSWKTFQFPRCPTARYPKDPRVRKTEWRRRMATWLISFVCKELLLWTAWVRCCLPLVASGVWALTRWIRTSASCPLYLECGLAYNYTAYLCLSAKYCAH